LQGIYVWEMSLTFTNAQALSIGPVTTPSGTPAPGI
jgi:hypothetical protein